VKQPADQKEYFYVDESGDPTILGRRGRNLLSEGVVSRVFTVGYIETSEPRQLFEALQSLREEIADDQYLAGVPSMASTLRGFHANKDCAEVRERVFRLLKTLDFQAFAVVARKDESRFRKKFDHNMGRLYEYLVTKLLENRLHLNTEIDIYFSEMGNVVREHTMRRAIDEATSTFRAKWGRENTNTIRVFVQNPSQIPQLQITDYMLWTIHRAYERGDFRFYRFVAEKFGLIQDIFDTRNYPNTYYTAKRLLDPDRIKDPADG